MPGACSKLRLREAARLSNEGMGCVGCYIVGYFERSNEALEATSRLGFRAGIKYDGSNLCHDRESPCCSTGTTIPKHARNRRWGGTSCNAVVRAGDSAENYTCKVSELEIAHARACTKKDQNSRKFKIGKNKKIEGVLIWQQCLQFFFVPLNHFHYVFINICNIKKLTHLY